MDKERPPAGIKVGIVVRDYAVQMYRITTRCFLGGESVGVECPGESGQGPPLGWRLLRDGIGACKQAKHHGNQYKTAASVHTSAPLLRIGISGRTSSPFHVPAHPEALGVR